MMVRELNPEKRTTILNTALKLFVKNGVHHTSTAEISKEAGIAAGTLFLYFPTKQELIDHLAIKICRDQANHTTSSLEPDLSARETFLRIWDCSIDWFMDHLDAYQYIQQVRDTGMLSHNTIEESEKLFGYYYMAIKKGLDEKTIKSYPLEIIGNMLYHDIVAVMNLIIAQPDQTKQNEYIHLGFNIYWDGISK